jgi:hypothetical protein
MKSLAILIALVSIYIIAQAAALTPQNVGEDFGKSWLQEHGKQPNIALNTTGLWNWGSVPKGYTIYNGKPIPPGSGPQWYYPGGIMNNNTPIITNSTALDRMASDPWILAIFADRPVMVINTSAGPLF